MTFKPIKPLLYFDNKIAKEIINWEWNWCFKPIFDILKSNYVINDNNAIFEYLKSGALYYQNGAFYSKTGRFANKIALKEKLNIDTYLLDDILDALSNPLRDIRDNFDTPQLRSDVLRLEDLTVGMELEGTVRNVVDFGCFIDCGLHGDGLLHISKMTKGYIKHPSDMFSVGQLVKVYVYKVDLVKQKLQLTMFKNEE